MSGLGEPIQRACIGQVAALAKADSLGHVAGLRGIPATKRHLGWQSQGRVTLRTDANAPTYTVVNIRSTVPGTVEQTYPALEEKSGRMRSGLWGLHEPRIHAETRPSGFADRRHVSELGKLVARGGECYFKLSELLSERASKGK